MAGKPRKDRSKVSAHHLGLRLRTAHFAFLQALVADDQARALAERLPTSISLTTFIQTLIEQEAERRGLSVAVAPDGLSAQVYRAVQSVDPSGTAREEFVRVWPEPAPEHVSAADIEPNLDEP